MDQLEVQRLLAEADAADARRPPPAPPTEQDLEKAVADAALAVRRVRNRLQSFHASSRHSNALEVPLAVFNQAVDRLAAFRGCQ